MSNNNQNLETLTEKEIELLRALKEGKVLTKNSNGIYKPVKPLLPRFVYTAITYENVTQKDIPQGISPLVYMVALGAQYTLNAVDTNKQELGSPLEEIVSNKRLPSKYVDFLKEGFDYNFETILKEAKREIINAIALIRTYFSNNYSSIEKEFYEEKFKEYLKDINETILKDEVNNTEEKLGENLKKVIDTILRSNLNEINNSTNPRTQSLAQTLVYLQARYKLGLDSEYDIIVVGMDLEGMKHNNEEIGPNLVDNLLEVYSKKITEITRERDIGFRYHGSGGDEYVYIFFFPKNPNENNLRKPEYNPFNQQIVEKGVKNFANTRIQYVILGAVKAELAYIQYQIDHGNYIIKN